ncbi:hypothetical protein S83_041784 [Arachis hypogaea]|nr:putative disease resistance RPP13-like protein [Arachis hypogaea]
MFLLQHRLIRLQFILKEAPLNNMLIFFLLFFTIFFSKQELISLWVAQGLFTTSSKRVEDQVFDSLLSAQVVASRLDSSVDFLRTFLYKINQFKLKFSAEYMPVFDGDIDSVPNDVKYFFIDAKSIKHVGFESLERF